MTREELNALKERYAEANPSYWIPRLIDEIESLQARVADLQRERERPRKARARRGTRAA